MTWQQTEPDKVLFDGDWHKVVQRMYRLPSGHEKAFDIVESKTNDASVGVVAVTEDGQAVIAEQFRPGPGIVMQEIVAGMVDPGEDPKTAAMRELQEETGYTADPDQMVYLGRYYRGPYQKFVSHYYFAPKVRLTSDQRLDDGEYIDVKLTEPAELLASAADGRTTEAVGVLLARDHLERYKKQAASKTGKRGTIKS
ncbi:MAG: NUDIX hydrolase [Candidatus Nomurabacteria bacterium]|jgi:ADP-ribose pyrophosphatase|nr:NUDIX hydrolase [Candidatus Nomurabacteria bacterium]